MPEERPPLLLLIILVLTTMVARGGLTQPVALEVLGLADGLPQSQAVTLAQDADGYIWVGTLGGLGRYNGVTFETLTTDHGLPSNRVYELLLDRHQTLWIATSAGLARWREHQLESVTDATVAGVYCRALASDELGRVWVGTETGLAISDSGPFEPVSTGLGNSVGRIHDLLAVPGGMLAATDSGLLRLALDGTAQRLDSPPIESGELRTIAQTGDTLWAGVTGSGLWARPGETWHRHPLPTETVWRVAVDDTGTLLVATADAGLFLKPPGDPFRQVEGLPSMVVNDALRDREGTLWVATDYGGLARLADVPARSFGTDAGLPDACVFAINAGVEPDSLWMGTLHGAARLRTEPEVTVDQLVTAADGLADELVWEAVPHRGSLWLRTESGMSVRSLQPGSRVERVSTPLTPGSEYDLLVDRQDRLWLAGNNPTATLAMHQADGTWKVFDRPLGGRSLEACYALAASSAGGVWVGTENSVFHCDGETITDPPTPPPLPAGSRVSSMLEDRRGRLWVGNDAGLVRREPDGQWRLLNATPGFDNHQVYFVGEDSSDGVWVGTARGVFRFAADDTVRALTLGDGLAHLESNSGAFICDRGGRVWIGTVGGLSRYDGSEDRGNPVPPRLVVESVQIGDRTVPFPGNLNLRWSERNVTFSVAMLTFRDPSRASYRARLSGLESDWIPLRRSPELRYTNLPPGQHQLQLQPFNESGVEGEIVEFEIAVSPPFWLATWFQIAMVVAVVGLGVVAHRWRTVVLRRRAAALETQIKQRTSELLVANRELTHLATHEPLTGIANRRAILDGLDSLLAPQGGGRRRFACILVDLDRFKLVNDRHGHVVGDSVLRQMATAIEGVLREHDRVGRYGGDEFLILLPGSDLEALTSVADRVTSLEVSVGTGDDAVTVTASCGGVAVRGTGALSAGAVLAAADERLYRVKERARAGAEVDELIVV